MKKTPLPKTIFAFPYLAPFLIILAIAITFAPALQAGFLSMDDPVTILENPDLQTVNLDHFKRILTRPVQNVYVPLTILSFWAEYSLAGPTPWVFHLNNLLLHLGVSLLVYYLARRLGLPPRAALLGGLIFALHPTRVESVLWITERKDVLYSLFYLLALHQYWTYLQTRQARAYGLSLICGLLSVLAKPMALSLPWILLLFDWLANRRWDRSRILDKIPFFLGIEAVALITYRLHARVPDLRWPQSLWLWLWSAFFYPRKFFFPDGQSIFYPLPRPISLNHPSYLIAILGLAAIIGLLIVARRDRWLRFAGLYYLGSSFFLFQMDTQGGPHPVADRFMYLPSLGFCLWLGLRLTTWLDKIPRRWPRLATAPHILAGFLTLALAWSTYSYARLWTDEEQLWTQAIQYNPQAFYAYRNRGAAYAQRGRHDLALADYQKAITIKPDFAPAYFNRATSYRKQNRLDLALADYNTAIQLDPDYADPYNNRAVVHIRQGHPDLALKDLDRFLTLRPDALQAYFNRGKLLVNMKRYAQALPDLNRFLAQRPNDAAAYYLRARSLLGQGLYPQAAQDLEQTLRLQPTHPKARARLQDLHRMLLY